MSFEDPDQVPARIGCSDPGARKDARERVVPPEGLMLHPAAHVWLALLSLSVLLVYVLFFLLFFNKSGPNDSDQYLVFHRLQYWNAELFGLSNQWTPVMCSGL